MTDPLLDQVRRTAEGFSVFGELGRRSENDVWYLGRDLSTRQLAALRLRQERVDAGEPVFSLEVAFDLDGEVALGEGRCPACGGKLREFARFCSRCGIDLAMADRMPKTAAERAALLEEVRASAGDGYEVIGEMPWSGGVGVVYFALERATGRLARLRLSFSTEGFQLGETVTALELKTQPHVRISASYTTGAGAPQVAAPPAAPPPPEPTGLRGIISKIFPRRQ